MSGWVHADDEAAWKADDSPGDCDCDTPTPDPASPCGQRDHPRGLPCGADASDDWHDRRTWELDPELWHPHQPTRCTCGHPIEERA